MSVGTAKAVAAQEGGQSASTTLEWISGVVIFLVLHSMSTYDETSKDPPPLLQWLFTIDCMDYIWRLFSLLCIPRPSYSSEPEQTPRLYTYERNHTKNGTPVTLYRLFVCFTTTFFGLTKAIITYLGYSADANWVDWTLGVALTSILFILGMYENNTTGMWHAFFVPDHRTETQYSASIVAVTLGFLFWIVICFWMMYLIATNEYSAFFSTEVTYVRLADLTRLARLREDLFSACFVLFMLFVVFVSGFAGVASVAAIMNSSQLPKWKVAADRMMARGLPWKEGYVQLGSPGRRGSKKIAYHTIIFTTFLLGCAVFLAFWAVSVAANVEEVYIPSQSKPKPNRGFHAFFLVTILFQLCGAGATASLMWVVAWKVLLPPLLAFWRGEVDWDKGLMF